jgi:opacity protein-like surface antigen
MKTNKVAVMLFGCALTHAALAGTMGQSTHPEGWKTVATLSLGPTWADGGKTQTIYLESDLQQAYSANKKVQLLGSGEIFLGLQRGLAYHLQAQLGLAVATTTSTRLYGNVWQDADPDSNNFYYSYHINHTHIAVKGKLLTDIAKIIQPYINGSLGIGFNRADNYTQTPKLFEVPPMPPFTSHTQNTFTYTIGTGLQKALDQHWSVGIGYEFADWGKSSLSAAPGQTLNNSLQLNHLYTNQLQLSLSFVA